MTHIQNTYKEHVQERRAYGFTVLPYKVWLSWRVNKAIKDLTIEDMENHPETEGKTQ